MHSKPVKPIENTAQARILIVEDDDQNRKLFQFALTANGHMVKAAPNGAEGLTLFEQEAFDLVITDLGMPGISGWEVAKGVKKLNPKIPVILLSGWASQHEKNKIKESGIDYVLTKPCSLYELEETIQKVYAENDRELIGDKSKA
jgi:CheY-like chemotaxis protein